MLFPSWACQVSKLFRRATIMPTCELEICVSRLGLFGGNFAPCVKVRSGEGSTSGEVSTIRISGWDQEA